MTDTTNTTAAKHYAKRDPESQGAHYINHVYAITTEGLHATRRTSQLAHSDIEIERLRAALAAPAQAVPASVIMASVMRDDGGEHPAFCLMVAYRAEKDAKAALAMLTDEPAQQAAPDMTDAYAGAREDLSIWKKRALEAEALNRKFAASVNSPSFMGGPAAPSGAGEYPELPEWSKRDDLGGLVPGEVRQALRTYADATCAARVVYSRSMDLVRTFWQQHTESDALSMTMAELHDDVELVIRAARKPIEDGVLHALYADVMTGHYADGLHYWRGTPAHRFARAIEQAHGITAAQKGGQHAD